MELLKYPVEVFSSRHLKNKYKYFPSFPQKELDKWQEGAHSNEGTEREEALNSCGV